MNANHDKIQICGKSYSDCTRKGGIMPMSSAERVHPRFSVWSKHSTTPLSFLYTITTSSHISSCRTALPSQSQFAPTQNSLTLGPNAYRPQPPFATHCKASAGVSHSSLLSPLSSLLGALRRLRPAKACLRTLRRYGGSGLASIWAVGPAALPRAGGLPPQRPPQNQR